MFECGIDDLSAVGEADLVIGADGVNSRVRNSLAKQYGTSERMIGNRFIWYGTTRPFDCLSLTFRTNEHGTFCAHHYRYAPDMSTFIVECDDDAWRRAGLATMADGESRTYCETVFAPDLDGHRLMSNKSVWREFPLVSNARWHTNKTVLIGDALRTAHFSIGSGTRLAMDDALALARALRASKGDVAEALSAFEADRKPAAEKIVRASEASAAWYHAMPDHMSLSAYGFAHSYMTRTGRVSDDRLATLAPDFMARYRVQRRDDGT
jgi:2-polyprenyl-6-methoxyphenol hydroxylase-like FAD-dependent oxidoreductase